VFYASDLLFHLKEQSLSHEILEVFALKVQKHTFNVAVFARKEDFPIAKTAYRPLRIRVNAQYRFLTVRYHA
jgi:hypothetical protein